MLVISRKPSRKGTKGSSLKIGDCRVVVLGVVGGNVRLGIVADAEIPIVRDDVIKSPNLQGCDNEPARA